MSDRPLQSRMVNLKTILPLERVLAKVSEMYPEAQVGGATHDEEGKVLHCHVVIRFPSVTRWDELRKWLNDSDTHNYSKPAQSWRRSFRYLLHLDNPEKAAIPRENLKTLNLDETEIDQLCGASKLPILESLVAAQSLPLSRRFEFLVVTRGHRPSEVSAAIRCMLDLEKWDSTRSARGLLESALPSSLGVSEDVPESDLDTWPLFDDESGSAFYD